MTNANSEQRDSVFCISYAGKRAGGRNTILFVFLLFLNIVPLFSQTLTGVNGDSVTVNMGAKDGVRVGMTAFILKGEEVSGQTIMLKIAKIRISAVKPHSCTAEIVEQNKQYRLSRGLEVQFIDTLKPVKVPKPRLQPKKRPRPPVKPLSKVSTTHDAPVKPRSTYSDPVQHMTLAQKIRYADGKLASGNYKEAVRLYGILDREAPDKSLFADNYAKARQGLARQKELANIRKNLDYYHLVVEKSQEKDLAKAIRFQRDICRVDKSQQAQNLLKDLEYRQAVAKVSLPPDFEPDAIADIVSRFPDRSRQLLRQAKANRDAREARERKQLLIPIRQLIAQRCKGHPVTLTLSPTPDRHTPLTHSLSDLAAGISFPASRAELPIYRLGKTEKWPILVNATLRGTPDQPSLALTLRLDTADGPDEQTLTLAGALAESGWRTKGYRFPGTTVTGSGWTLTVTGSLTIRVKKERLAAGCSLRLTLARDPAPEQARIMSQPLQQVKDYVYPTITLPHNTPLEMTYIPAGTYRMGSPDSESDRDSDEGPRHRVTISKPFFMGKYEVTQAQWQAVMGNNPSRFKGDNLPVEEVSWDDCQKFIRKLNSLTGKHFRLPTEAEWEYACRAGTDTPYFFGSDPEDLARYANVADASAKRKHSGWTCISADDGYAETSPVGTFKPNGFGLYDMHGNVWEWCSDWYDSDYYKHSPATDPQGPASGVYRDFRGGGWGGRAGGCRSAGRGGGYPSFRGFNLGFRLVMEEWE